MSTVILLSSSPVNLFAKSPTPADVSSLGLTSPNAFINSWTNGEKGFKAAGATRDGCKSGFCGGKSVLAPRLGAQNLPLGTPTGALKIPEAAFSALGRTEKSTEGQTRVTTSRKSTAPSPPPIVQQCLPSDVRKRPKKVSSRSKNTMNDRLPKKKSKAKDAASAVECTLSPLLLEKATTRRLDWTPAKSGRPQFSTDFGTISPLTSAPGSLLCSFGYDSSLDITSLASGAGLDGPITKRRRLDLVGEVVRTTATNMAPPKFVPELKTALPSTAKAKNNSPKKYTTITGLATSNYISKVLDNEDQPLNLEYITTTQARDSEYKEKVLSDNAKRNRATQKGKNTKKAATVVTLLSPESALKKIDSQEMIFGSASQLARDESPEFLRDTLEALKRSESALMSDPISTQVTDPLSFESTTPKAARGTSRFAMARNLWAAAGRDEDNALLHVDTVDMSDSPDLRHAFAGKDVLLQSENVKRKDSRASGGQPSPFHAGKPGRAYPAACFDIDDIASPAFSLSPAAGWMAQSRSMHTSVRLLSPRRVSTVKVAVEKRTPTVAEPQNASRSEDMGEQQNNQPRLIKPSFTGYSTVDLRARLKSYGFKPIRKRERMIEVLDQCWYERHNIAPPPPINTTSSTAAKDVPTHGDFLSNVHGLSARSVPKVKKAKVSRSKQVRESTSVKIKPSRAKTTTAEKECNPEVMKAPRTRKSKAITLSEELVHDMDEIEDLSAEQSRYFDEASKIRKESNVLPGGEMVEKPEERAASKTQATEREMMRRTTNPPGVPLVNMLLSSPSVDTLSHGTAVGTPLSQSAELPAIHSQITRAITAYKEPPTHNHQRQPTWHEKILLYDPIALEDLAAWLNTTGFTAIGEDREVSAFEVRDWCEKEGVCCLWKYGWRGNGAAGGVEGEG